MVLRTWHVCSEKQRARPPDGARLGDPVQGLARTGFQFFIFLPSVKPADSSSHFSLRADGRPGRSASDAKVHWLWLPKRRPHSKQAGKQASRQRAPSTPRTSGWPVRARPARSPQVAGAAVPPLSRATLGAGRRRLCDVTGAGPIVCRSRPPTNPGRPRLLKRPRARAAAAGGPAMTSPRRGALGADVTRRLALAERLVRTPGIPGRLRTRPGALGGPRLGAPGGRSRVPEDRTVGSS